MKSSNKKKRILVICPYPKGYAPSQRFRIEQFINDPEISSALTFEIKSFWTLNAFKILYKQGFVVQKLFYVILGFLRRFIHIFSSLSYDFVLIHREASPIGPPIFEWVLAIVLRRKIIFDFDDAIWLTNTSDANTLAAGLKWHKKFYSICSWSWKILAGNEFLMTEAKKINTSVFLIPTVVDTNYYQAITPSQKGNKITIGWTGSHSTMSYLKIIEPIIQKLEKEYEFNFLVISNQKPELDLESLQFIKWKKESEIQDLSSIDIGIMPLIDNDWTRGKCGFKIIQYLSLGIPSIASDIPPNDKIIVNQKNGVLCESLADWENALRSLIESESLRVSFSKNGISHIKSYYSVSAWKNMFKSVFS
jgi:glycosyltransferase involved in cell wall biosynthesis